jgi:hypothetical protein
MMTNSWSLLFDKLNMTNQDSGISFMEGNPPYSVDTINFSGDTVIFGGEGTDTISFQAAQAVPTDYYSNDITSFDFDMTTSTNPNRFKYSEERILKELSEYISGTYRQHYSAGDDKIQTLDLIEACGDGEAFCRSNILKYASRYDKKGTARRDIVKILHYAVLLLHFNDKNANRETYPQ